MSEKGKQYRKRAVLVIILALPVSIYLTAILYSGEIDFNSLETIGPVEVVENEDGTFDTIPYRIPDFSFITQYGDTVTREDMKGKIYVASFFFTSCPTVCPNMNFHLKQVHDRLIAFKNIYFLSHSIDPYDTPEVLRDYAKFDLQLQNSNKWIFVTGEQDEVLNMADEYFLAASVDSARADHGGYAHSEKVVLVDWEGRIRCRKDDDGNVIGAYDISQAPDISVLVDDLRVLAKEYTKVTMGI